jgi:hypothetical protein
MEIAVADDGVLGGLAGAMHRDVLAEDIAIANPQPRGRAWYWKSCGASPMTQPVWKWLPSPMLV